VFNRACADQLPEALLTETWEEAGLRDAFHWLWTFVYGLSGDGAPLPGTGQQTVLPAPAPVANLPEAPLLEQVLAVLTVKQGRIMSYLWDRKTASYETLRTIPDAWQGGPTDEAITAQLKRIRTRLDENNLSVVSLTISEAGQRVTLDRPTE
jgi:hypothetical protein